MSQFHRSTRRTKSILSLISLLILAALLLAQTASAANAIEKAADVDGMGLTTTALALDSSGNPVIAFYQANGGNLYVVHCDDPACAGVDPINGVDFLGDVGDSPALILDANGFPVISYYHVSGKNLKVAHCNDPDCAGGDESIVTVDSQDDSGNWSSIQLDANGFPVISYSYEGAILKVAHCNDANCAGGDESIQGVNYPEFGSRMTSLALDSNGFPVVSHFDIYNKLLRLAHCNDANCAGGDESSQVIENITQFGGDTSLELDANGFPVISYHHGFMDLKLAHCNDANCAGGNESIQIVDDSTNDVGRYSSLELDANGLPVISYFNASLGKLKLARCNDANCAGGNESIQTVDSAQGAGRLTSLALDANGFPVISYDVVGDLFLAHCDTLDCHLANLLTTTATGTGKGAMSAPGINCHYNAGLSGDCTEMVNAGTTVFIVAAPERDSVIGPWAGCAVVTTTNIPGDTCRVAMTAAKTVSATFTIKPVLTVEGRGPGSGSMIGGGIDCQYANGVASGGCFTMAASGASLSIVAVPDGLFNVWAGCDSIVTTNIPGDTCRVTLTSDRLIAARFDVANGATQMHVSELNPAPELGQTNWRPGVSVQVVDNLGAPVPDVTVTGTWQLGEGQDRSCLTGPDGRCTIQTAKPIAFSIIAVVFDINTITGGPLIYTPASNVATSVVVDQTLPTPPPPPDS